MDTRHPWLGERSPVPRTELWLFCLITAAAAAYCAFHETVVLDDAFIYFRVVHNLVDFGRAEVNPGDGLFAVTSPLWTVLLALPAKVWPSIPVHQTAEALWLLLLVLASTFAFLTTRRFAGPWACCVALPFFLPPVINSMMGTEIALLYAALFFTLWACLGRRALLTGVGIGIGYLARGEFILMLVPVLLHFLLVPRASGERPGGLGTAARLALGVVPFAAAWHIYLLFVYDSLFAGTLHAKLLQGASGEWRLYHDAVVPYLRQLFDGRAYLIVPVLLGLARLRHLAFLLGTYTLLHYAVYRGLTVPDYHWYHYDFYVLALLSLVFGIGSAVEWVDKLGGGHASGLRQTAAPGIARWALFLLLLLPSLRTDLAPLSAESWRRITSRAPGHPRLHTYLQICAGLKERIQPGDVVLTPEIGILGYCLRGHVIRDLSGLATPIRNHQVINDHDHFVRLLEPRFVFVPRGGQPETRLFVGGGVAYTYRRLLQTSSASGLQGSTLYVLDEARTSREPELLLLGELERNARLSPDVRWLQVEDHLSLFCHAPCESTIELPPGTRRIELEAGFSPDLARFSRRVRRDANGVRVVLSTGDGQHRPEERSVHYLPPFDDSGKAERQLLTVEPLPGDTRLSIYLDAIEDDTDFDWTYLRVVSLTGEQ